MVTDHCCEAMARQVNWHRDSQHDDPFDCPDALVFFNPKFQEYGLIIHDGGRSTVEIYYCPWCGQRLPDSQRERWFDELEARGIDPWEDDIPPEFEDDRWLTEIPKESQ